MFSGCKKLVPGVFKSTQVLLCLPVLSLKSVLHCSTGNVPAHASDYGYQLTLWFFNKLGLRHTVDNIKQSIAGGVGHDVIDNCVMYPCCTFCHRNKLY